MFCRISDTIADRLSLLSILHEEQRSLLVPCVLFLNRAVVPSSQGTANMEFHDPEKDTSLVSHTLPVANNSQAISGQGPSAGPFQLSDDGPTDAENSTEDAAPDTEPDPEALTRANSGPVYSAFTPGMKRWIITVVTFTSFISPMTAVSTHTKCMVRGP